MGDFHILYTLNIQSKIQMEQRKSGRLLFFFSRVFNPFKHEKESQNLQENKVASDMEDERVKIMSCRYGYQISCQVYTLTTHGF
jgi:hypothetical protein